LQVLFRLSIVFLILSCASLFAFAEQGNNEQSNNEQSANKDKKAKKNTSNVPLPIALDQQYKTDLKHYLPSTKVKPILVGAQEYITLVNESTSPNSKGVTILIPDWQQGAVNPKAINFLRKSLPKQGWTTISVQPNAKPDNYPSTALKLATQREENQKIIDNYKNNFSTMIETLSNKAQEYPGIVIMIAQGNHGVILLDVIESNASLQTPSAVILLSSYPLTGQRLLDEDSSKFAKALANSEMPILDLYLKYDNATVIDKAPQRLAAAKQEMKVYYRQRQLNNTAVGFYPEQALLTTINSWLKSIGW